MGVGTVLARCYSTFNTLQGPHHPLLPLDAPTNWALQLLSCTKEQHAVFTVCSFVPLSLRDRIRLQGMLTVLIMCLPDDGGVHTEAWFLVANKDVVNFSLNGAR